MTACLMAVIMSWWSFIVLESGSNKSGSCSRSPNHVYVYVIYSSIYVVYLYKSDTLHRASHRQPSAGPAGELRALAVDHGRRRLRSLPPGEGGSEGGIGKRFTFE